MSESNDAEGLVAEFESVKQRSLWLDGLDRLVRNRASMLGLFIAVLIVSVAIFGPYMAPYDYLRQDLSSIRSPPSWEHWMGTDLVGRDIMSRIMLGARTAVFVALVVVTVSTTLGVVLGAIAAFGGGRVDDLIMRIADVTFGFPDLLLAAFLSIALRQPVISWVGVLYQRTGWELLKETLFLDYALMFGALSLVGWAGYARLIRGQILSLRERDFIRAEVALGIPDRVIISRHLLPNSMAPVIVSLTISIGSTMLSEASLSFLGLGIQPPGASWGNMINDGLGGAWLSSPHLVAMPGLALAIAVFGFNFLGDGINDALNPREIRR